MRLTTAGAPASGAAQAPNAPRGRPGARARGGGAPAASERSSSASHAPDAASAAARSAAVAAALSASPPGASAGHLLGEQQLQHTVCGGAHREAANKACHALDMPPRHAHIPAWRSQTVCTATLQGSSAGWGVGDRCACSADRTSCRPRPAPTHALSGGRSPPSAATVRCACVGAPRPTCGPAGAAACSLACMHAAASLPARSSAGQASAGGDTLETRGLHAGRRRRHARRACPRSAAPAPGANGSEAGLPRTYSRLSCAACGRRRSDLACAERASRASAARLASRAWHGGQNWER